MSWMHCILDHLAVNINVPQMKTTMQVVFHPVITLVSWMCQLIMLNSPYKTNNSMSRLQLCVSCKALTLSWLVCIEKSTVPFETNYVYFSSLDLYSMHSILMRRIKIHLQLILYINSFINALERSGLCNKHCLLTIISIVACLFVKFKIATQAHRVQYYLVADFVVVMLCNVVMLRLFFFYYIMLNYVKLMSCHVCSRYCHVVLCYCVYYCCSNRTVSSW